MDGKLVHHYTFSYFSNLCTENIQNFVGACEQETPDVSHLL